MQIGEYTKTVVIPKRYVEPVIIPTKKPEREKVSIPLIPQRKEKVDAR